MRFLLLLFSTLILASEVAQSQTGPDQRQLGVFYGKVLPKNIDGIDEIFSLWGLRYGQSVNSDGSILVEGTFWNNADKLADWLGVSLGLRFDFPIESFVAFALVGLDYTRYNAPDTSAKQTGGAHAGGGLLAHIGGNAHFRFDLKSNAKPGHPLVFGMGFVFDF